eukprot:SAG31_NODE_4718_length_3010_cov_2.593267_1_plen_178_part_00
MATKNLTRRLFAGKTLDVWTPVDKSARHGVALHKCSSQSASKLLGAHSIAGQWGILVIFEELVPKKTRFRCTETAVKSTCYILNLVRSGYFKSMDVVPACVPGTRLLVLVLQWIFILILCVQMQVSIYLNLIVIHTCTSGFVRLFVFLKKTHTHTHAHTKKRKTANRLALYMYCAIA